jgi:hypothetical protein
MRSDSNVAGSGMCSRLLFSLVQYAIFATFLLRSDSNVAGGGTCSQLPFSLVEYAIVVSFGAHVSFPVLAGRVSL